MELKFHNFYFIFFNQLFSPLFKSIKTKKLDQFENANEIFENLFYSNWKKKWFRCDFSFLIQCNRFLTIWIHLIENRIKCVASHRFPNHQIQRMALLLFHGGSIDFQSNFRKKKKQISSIFEQWYGMQMEWTIITII